MESRIRVLFLNSLLFATVPLALYGPQAAAQVNEDGDVEQVFEPEIDRREIKEARIDTEDFEIGIFAGGMSVEDFGVNTVVGVRFAYHVTEDFFVEASAGRTDTEETSFERLSGGAPILNDDEREFTYYNVAFGYNVLPGEAFVGGKRAFNTGLYIMVGAGNTDFAGDNRFTVNYGAGYRFLATDIIAVRLDFRDHIFDIDILGEEKTAHNIEAYLGVSLFF